MWVLLLFVLFYKYTLCSRQLNDDMRPSSDSSCNTVVECLKWCHLPSSHSGSWPDPNRDSAAGLFSREEKWESQPTPAAGGRGCFKDTEVTKGVSSLVWAGTLSTVMAHIEINLWSRSVVLMLNKPCQETALHILSSIVGADEAPLQYSGRTGLTFPHYIQTHIFTDGN